LFLRNGRRNFLFVRHGALPGWDQTTLPLFLDTGEHGAPRPRYFYFEKQWLLQPDLTEWVKIKWQESVDRRPEHNYSMDNWHGCLCYLRQFLKGWNLQKVGEQNKNKRELLLQLAAIDVVAVRNKHVHVCRCVRTSACRSAAAWSDCKREVQGRAGVVSAVACTGVYCRCVRVHGVLACKVVAARCVDRVSWLGVVCVARVLRGGGRNYPERGAEAAKSWLSTFRGPSALAVVEESSPAYKKPQCSSL
jgi:hypothetical protein